jgi:23S rRNA (cytidine1920-2'-O)/16S rRNA (cytidine1409-2'-O)-methyltransferase
MLVPEDIEVEISARPKYVSRGGEKLENALRELEIDVVGKHCLDVGASTGGFTDCLLQSGAAHVVAVDVGYGELDWRIRTDERVTVIERRNARDLIRGELPYEPDLITVDVSFIGLAKVLPALAALAASRFDLLALVKPQFEVGADKVGSGGVVRSAEDRFRALVEVGRSAIGIGLAVQRFCPSGLPGPAGNRESFIWCTERARSGVTDIEGAALEAEPEAAGAASVAP